MKNYMYKWQIMERGYKEVGENEYDERIKEKVNYIAKLSDVVKTADCGWDKVVFKLMSSPMSEYYISFMVLCAEDGGERWIPIEGNSKACNLAVLGENLF